MQEQADAFIGFVLVGGFAFLLAMMVRIALSTTAPRRRCERHTWSHHPQTEKLTCTECGYVPTDEA